jgi:protein-S-isoprenylcysteine O-methyltransferase Ste14
MISGVAITLLGVAVVTGSVLILAWMALFVGINHAYFLLVEEPGLVRRFGAPYEQYRRQVPRWIPRREP